MIDKILEIISEIKPKSLFSKITSDASNIILTTSKEIPNLKVDKILVEVNGIIRLSTKEINNERFKFIKETKIESIVSDIYEILKCRLLALKMQINYYDVWGNEKDGWDINDVIENTKWTEELLISEFDDVLLSDKEIKELISEIFGYTSLKFEIEWNDYTFNLKNGDYFSFGYDFNELNGKPLGTLFITDDMENIQLLS